MLITEKLSCLGREDDSRLLMEQAAAYLYPAFPRQNHTKTRDNAQELRMKRMRSGYSIYIVEQISTSRYACSSTQLQLRTINLHEVIRSQQGSKFSFSCKRSDVEV
jgi:hypothetical protein